MFNSIPIAQEVPAGSENSDIPIAVARSVEPSAPPSFDIAPDDEAEWPSVKVYGANFVPDLLNLKKTIDILEVNAFQRSFHMMRSNEGFKRSVQIKPPEG